MEAQNPGTTALWLSAAGADTVSTRGAFIPEIDERGKYLNSEGLSVERLEEAAPAEDPLNALGRFLATKAQAALSGSSREPADLEIKRRFVWLPIDNPLFALAAQEGILRGLGDWLMGREVTRSWASEDQAPACGPLGCLRYRMDHIQLGRLQLITTPGALDDGLVRGRPQSEILYPRHEELLDLDADSVLDSEDEEIRRIVEGPDGPLSVSIPTALNPQRFEALEGLESEEVWVLGRCNGGVGTLAPWGESPNIFEGALSTEQEQGLLQRLASLIDWPGNHLLSLEDGPEREHSGAWWIEGPGRHLSGRYASLGPGPRAYLPELDLLAEGVSPGDLLSVEGAQFYIQGLLPVELAQHPNVTGRPWDLSPQSGAWVFNTACELLERSCHRGQGEDPNASLPRGLENY